MVGHLQNQVAVFFHLALSVRLGLLAGFDSFRCGLLGSSQLDLQIGDSRGMGVGEVCQLGSMLCLRCDVLFLQTWVAFGKARKRCNKGNIFEKMTAKEF